MQILLDIFATRHMQSRNANIIITYSYSSLLSVGGLVSD